MIGLFILSMRPIPPTKSTPKSTPLLPILNILLLGIVIVTTLNRMVMPPSQESSSSNSSWLCGTCDQPVNWGERGLACNTCGQWYHTHCQSMDSALYQQLEDQGEEVPWHCAICGSPNSHTALDLHGTDLSITSLQTDASTSCLTPTNSKYPRPIHASTPLRSNQQNKWKKRPLRIVNTNFRSAPGKKPEILNMLDSIRPDILIGTETWLDSSIGDAEIFPETYKLFRKDRNRTGGGVLIAVHNSIESFEVLELQTDCEIVWVKVKLQGRKYLYISSYYRPNVSDEDSLAQFNLSLEKAALISNSQLLIGGDLNFPSWDWRSMTLKPKPVHTRLHYELIDILNNHGLEQLVEEPTRENNTLDLFITNCPQIVPRITILPGLSDHSAVYCEVQVHTIKKKQIPRSVPLYKKANWEGIKTTMASLAPKMEELSNTASIEDMWTIFRDTLHAATKEHIPHKQISSKDSYPWITPALRRLINKRNRLFKKMRKQGTYELKLAHKELRREIQRQLRRAYWSHLNSLFQDADREAPAVNKRFWSYIKHQKSSNTGVGPLRHEGKLTTDPKIQASLLNHQFQSVFGSGETYTEEEFREKCDLQPSNPPKLNNIDITENGVRNLLSKLNPGKAPGPDNISPRILKELANEVAPILTTLFKSSLRTGNLPVDWKSAHVTPIFKKGERYNPSNYRPVSLTSVCCKLLEHILTSAIMNHMEEHSILCDEQHGFRSKRSCETQLLELTDELFNNLEEGKHTDILILDFAKAFDKVNHSLLMHKLNHYGVQGQINFWISNFLSNRKQAVVVSGEKSDFVPVKSGVPQGSVLGPCLFLAYINDLPSHLKSKARLFADDTAVYNTISSAEDQTTLQDDLNQLATWEQQWDMSFHPDKCTTLPITRSKQQNAHTYVLHGHSLETVNTAKYLGVTITKDLSWDAHINQITTKANKTLGFLRRNIRKSPRQTKEIAYKAFVRPILEYACSVWDPHSVTNKNKIEAVQRRAARFVSGRFHKTASPTAMMKELHWPSLQERRRTARLKMLFKIQERLICTEGIQSKLSKAPPRRRRGHKQQFNVPQCRTQYRQSSFLPQTIRDWNHLPEDVVEAKTLDSFVSRLTQNP